MKKLRKEYPDEYVVALDYGTASADAMVHYAERILWYLEKRKGEGIEDCIVVMPRVPNANGAYSDGGLRQYLRSCLIIRGMPVFLAGDEIRRNLGRALEHARQFMPRSVSQPLPITVFCNESDAWLARLYAKKFLGKNARIFPHRLFPESVFARIPRFFLERIGDLRIKS